MSTETALITGSSSGIGFHLAREFARHGHPLILVAPDRAELDEVASGIRGEHGVDVRVIAADLEQPDAPQQVFEESGAASGGVDILVNNAGHGQKGKFWEIPLARHLSILRLNVEALLRMTRLFLPHFIMRRSGRLLNTASVAGFMPGPNLAVYHASKAFVLSLTESLATEAEGYGVTVTALCPGPTDTDFFPKADMTEVKGFQKANLMAPREVAAAGYEALMKGERIIVPGAANKALVFSRRFLSEDAQASLNEKFYEDVSPKDHKRERGDMERKAELAQRSR